MSSTGRKAAVAVCCLAVLHLGGWRQFGQQQAAPPQASQRRCAYANTLVMDTAWFWQGQLQVHSPDRRKSAHKAAARAEA